MDESAPKGLYLVAGILLAILIITFAILTYNKTKPMQKQADSNLNTINQALTSNSYGAYDGQTVTGATVISAINTKASPEVIVHVTTNTTSKDYSSASYNVADVNDPKYIEESSNFAATLNKNGNGSIVGITFTQIR